MALPTLLVVASALAVPPLTASAQETPPLAVGSAYVALGDSYSSAPGVDPYLADTRCSRSAKNYAHLTAADLGLALTDATCSGAGTRHLIEAQYDADGQLVQGPQLEALIPDASLVTLGLGGNDGDYFRNMLLGWPFDHLATADLIRANVVDGIETIRAIAPAARVVVVGYPMIYPAEGWCDELGLPPEQVPAARDQNRVLATAMQTAADQAGADFIEMFDRSAGHDICSADPWVQGRTSEWSVATPFHPRLAEQEAVRDALVQLTGPAPVPIAPTATTTHSDAAVTTATPTATATAAPTPTASAGPTPTPTASAAPTPTPTPTASAVPPRVTWYARQGAPVIGRRVSVPRPACAPAVCSVQYVWRVSSAGVGSGSALYLRRGWLGRYLSVRITVRANGLVATRTYKWLRPIRRP